MTDPAEPVICLGGCRRRLRAEKSRARGYGPDCWEKLHGPTPGRPHIPAPAAATPGPDQPELPLTDQLAIWET